MSLPDFDLHRMIWKIAGHKIIHDLLSHLEVRIRMFTSLQAPLFEKLVDSIQDHNSIVKAIADGDGKAASEIVQQHIKEAGILVVDHMKEQTTSQQSGAE